MEFTKLLSNTSVVSIDVVALTIATLTSQIYIPFFLNMYCFSVLIVYSAIHYCIVSKKRRINRRISKRLRIWNLRVFRIADASDSARCAKFGSYLTARKAARARALATSSLRIARVVKKLSLCPLRF